MREIELHSKKYPGLIALVDDDPTAQCPLALNGLGPFKDHCRACMRALRPPRGYPVWDYLGRPIVSTSVELT